MILDPARTRCFAIPTPWGRVAIAIYRLPGRDVLWLAIGPQERCWAVSRGARNASSCP